ncbi:MAG: Fe-S-containing protein [Acidobacteriota bacterium]
MLEALVITLREGVEAALVVGIIVTFLRREGLERHLRTVWVGIAAAVVGSFAGAFALYRAAVNEEVFEGLLYLTSAIVVASMAAWMWRHSQGLSGEIKGSLGTIVRGERFGSVGVGLFVFTFLMVAREGVETVLFLSALSLSSGGLMALLGAAIGIGLAVLFGILFVRGSLRVDLRRFFAITGMALVVFVIQLLCNAYHELSEAGWLPANPRTMAVLGPLVRNEFFFFAAVLILPLLMLIVPGKPAPIEVGANPAEARLQRAQQQRQRRARLVGGVLGIAILTGLGLQFVYGQASPVLSSADRLTPSDGRVSFAAADLKPGDLKRFSVTIEGVTVRFIAFAAGEPGHIGTAFDACEICGSQGYFQDGSSILCLHCRSAVYPPSIGQGGGCNPIPLPSRTDGPRVSLAMSDLAKGAKLFR